MLFVFYLTPIPILDSEFGIANCAEIASSDDDDSYLVDFDSVDGLEDELHLLIGRQRFVSIATKSKQKVSNASSIVTVITAEEIENMGFRDLDDLLNFIPGFETVRDVNHGNATAIVVRGRLTSQSESVLVLFDGIPLNDLYSGGISIINRMVALENVERVEIIRGPGSAVYGANAVMGVINIIPKNADSQDHLLNVNAQYGSFEAKKFNLSLSKKIKKNLSFYLFGQFYSDTGETFFIPSDVWKGAGFTFSGNQKDSWRNKDLFLKVNYGEFQFGGRYMERHTEDFLAFGSIGNHDENTEQYNIYGKWKHDLSDYFELNLTGGYSAEKWDTLALVVPKIVAESIIGGPFPSDAIQGPLLRSHTFYTDGQLSYDGLNKHQLMFGWEFRRQRMDDAVNQGNSSPATLEFTGKITRFEAFNNEGSSRFITGLFLQDIYGITDQLTLTAGVRFDHYDDIHESSINPRVALTYELIDDVTLKVMYGSAFRVPSWIELFDKNNPITVGNPDLEPETTQTFDIGVEVNKERLNLSLNGFITSTKDVITRNQDVADATPFFENKGELSITGMEGSARYFFNENFNVGANFTYLFKAENRETNTDLDRISDFLGNAWFNWTFLDDFKLNFNLHAKGSKNPAGGLGTQGVGSAVFFNSHITYSGLLDNLKLTFSAYNLSDKKYSFPFSKLEEGIPVRERQILFSLEYSY
ncbi:MAG: TonB-dependent receptor plug domain-containing protein [Candidatus Anammoxibacter sp.]